MTIYKCIASLTQFCFANLLYPKSEVAYFCQCRACSVSESKVDLGGRVDKSSIKYRPSTLLGGEDFSVNKLYLANTEMDKLLNEER